MTNKAETTRNIILEAQNLDGILSPHDKKTLLSIEKEFGNAVDEFQTIKKQGKISEKSRKKLIEIYDILGTHMQNIVKNERRIHVYSFETPSEVHGEASRLIAKLRDSTTETPEFIYYIQRAYELLFNLAFGVKENGNKNYKIIATPVNIPVQNYAIHKIPDIDHLIENIVMCVILRGAILPSMIFSKEIQQYSSNNHITPFALFKIQRDDTREEHDMRYILDLGQSYFDLEKLDGKDLIFADPMNATGGSLITIVDYLTKHKKIKPKSVKFLNVIAALKGAFRIARAFDNAEVYTLWMDPVMNDKAYIMPGLGDAGDRLNGADRENPRGMLQLIAGYGTNIISLYRTQVREIERTVLGR